MSGDNIAIAIISSFITALVTVIVTALVTSKIQNRKYRSTLNNIIVTLVNQFAWHGDRLIWIKVVGISYGHICLEAIGRSYYKYLDMHDDNYDRLQYIDMMFDDLSQVARHLNIPATERTIEISRDNPSLSYVLAKEFTKDKLKRYHKILYRLVMDIPSMRHEQKLEMWTKIKKLQDYWDKTSNCYIDYCNKRQNYFKAAENAGVWQAGAGDELGVDSTIGGNR